MPSFLHEGLQHSHPMLGCTLFTSDSFLFVSIAVPFTFLSPPIMPPTLPTDSLFAHSSAYLTLHTSSSTAFRN